MPFKCEDVKEGDQLLAVEGCEGCFRDGQKYEVQGIREVNPEEQNCQFKFYMQCSCGGDIGPEWWPMYKERISQFKHEPQNGPW